MFNRFNSLKVEQDSIINVETIKQEIEDERLDIVTSLILTYNFYE